VRIVDFGIAKAISNVSLTEAGKVKGKLAYLSPEQLNGTTQDRRVDVFAAGIVLFESLTGQRLFGGGEPANVIARLMQWEAAESAFERVPEAFRAITRRALAVRPEERFATAREMAVAIQNAVPPAGGMVIAEWLQSRAGETLAERAAIIADMERTPVDDTNDARVFDSIAPVPAADRTNVATVKNVLRENSRHARWAGAFALLVCVVGLALALRSAHRIPETSSIVSNGAAVEAAPTAPALAPLPPVAALPTAPNDIPVVEPNQLPSEPQPVEASRPTAARRPHVDCKVPFTIDSDGLKHFKPECFR